MISSLIYRFRGILKAGVHVVVIALSLCLAFLLRFDLNIPSDELEILQLGLLLAIPIKFVVYKLSGMLRAWWRICGLPDAYRIFAVNVLATLLFAAATLIVIGPDFSRSVYIIDFLLCSVLMAFIRFFDRFAHEILYRGRSARGFKQVLIYGAGSAGATLVREIRSNRALKYEVVGFLDDEIQKRQSRVMGIRVLGTGRDCVAIAETFRRRNRSLDEVIIAMPSASGRQMREAVANVRAAELTCKTIPGLGDLLEQGPSSLSRQIRNVDIQDLVGREAVYLEASRIRQALAGQAVLVTGGAGSIGSELCRQIAPFEPKQLVILDQAESDLYRIELELRGAYPNLDLAAEIGDIRDVERLSQIFTRYPIRHVYHAAAYKHVPMMELNSSEAVKNNILGTWNLAQAARRHRVETFLMISSDKAVNPTNVMGATKRVAELIVNAMASASAFGTKFVSVRFGNVLGSNGSVVPLFQQQISSGGPVTVTHPEVRRFFMTVREAVQLVLQASVLGSESEIFVLDMGDPIRVVDLARNMIRLAGLEPDRDIEIRYVGLRPGEKLFEEVMTESEYIKPTHHDKIKVFQGPSVSMSRIELWIRDLEHLLKESDDSSIREHIRDLVPEFKCEFRAATALMSN